MFSQAICGTIYTQEHLQRKPYQYWGTSSSTPPDHTSRNRGTFHSHPPCHPPPSHPWQGVAKTELYLGKNVRMIWMLMLCLAFFLLLPLKTFRKISTFFSMRILTKSLVEQGLFFFCLVLILSHAFVPERDGMCHKSEQSSWWRFAGHFKFLWHQKSVSLISRQQKPLSSLQGWLSVEKNCFAVCKRASFGPNVSGSVVFVKI